MSSVNKVIIVGNLGRDPELVETKNSSFCKFSVATNDGWGDNKKTNWHNVQVWGAQAESCAKYLAAGRQVYVEGRIDHYEFENSDGETVRGVQIVASDVRFLSGEKSDGKSQASAGANKGGRRRRGGQSDSLPTA